jgi:putative FmdB family regulatory protein
MPIYTYRCENCGVQFDRRQSFNDPPLKRCPECDKLTLRKVYQPVGIVFKGSGFYATDHRSPSGTGRASGKDSDSESKSESESETKSESKSESNPGPSTSSESKTKSD